jgi:hypothetical protein
MCSASFPRSSPLADASLPSTGSSGASSPASTVLSKRYDFLPPLPPRFVAFAWRYLGCTRSVRSSGGRVRRKRPGVGHPVAPAGMYRGNDRSSQVPGEPRLSVCPCSVDSGGTGRARPLRRGSVALGIRKAKAPTKGFSKLNSMAFGLAAGTVRSMVGFAVEVAPHHARLASGRWSGATGRAFHPQGSNERFQISLRSSHPPFPSFLAQSDRPKQNHEPQTSNP